MVKDYFKIKSMKLLIKKALKYFKCKVIKKSNKFPPVIYQKTKISKAVNR